ERLGPLRQVLDRKLLRRRRRLGPVVVLADEDRGHAPELREVQRLVEGADVRRAVSEERDCDARLAAKLEGEGRAGDRRQPAADDRAGRDAYALELRYARARD